MMAMSICESEENRKKLAWLVPAYVLLAWFVCVLFQPLGLATRHATVGTAMYNTFRHQKYQVIYLDQSRVANDLCQNNSLILRPGNKSVAVFQLGSHLGRSSAFNCSLKVEAGPGLDGLTMMIEEMDLKENDVDTLYQSKAGSENVQRSKCQDFVEVYSVNNDVKHKFCGNWEGMVGSRHGPSPKMVDNGGNETASSFYVSISISYRMGKRYGLSFRERKAFTVVFTGYKTATPTENENSVPSLSGNETTVAEKSAIMEDMMFFEGEETPVPPASKRYGEIFKCGEGEFMCSPAHFSPDLEPHCVWDELKCDSHLNCAFNYNIDETDCPVDTFKPFREPWSMSTVSLLIVTYLAIVSILILVTMLLLRWHRTLRTPLEILSDSRQIAAARSIGGDIYRSPEVGVASGSIDPADLVDVGNPGAPGTVSIMVMYARTSAKVDVGNELPPSYESLFMGDNPPNYNVVNMPPEEVCVANAIQTTSVDPSYELGPAHCKCECDHTSCNNARD